MNTELAKAYKLDWQRRQRRAFQAAHGYSTAANSATAGLREHVLERDRRRCVRCQMTDEEHRRRWKRPITVDHIDRNRRHNTLSNLQTLCLPCHGRKDISPQLIVRKIEPHRDAILARRAAGQTYQEIADEMGFSIGSVWRWIQRWDGEQS